MYVRQSHVRNLMIVAAFAALVVLLWPQLGHAAPPGCEDGSQFDAARQKGWLWAFLGAFGAGFLTSLTPCVYPMIPIVLGVFGARGESVSRGKAMVLATLYVGGMGLTYAALGVIFAIVGGQFGSILADWRFVVPIVLIYVALAASMFGAFELNLPASWQAKLSTVGGAGYGGAFAMGLVGGFTAAPCTGPFLVGLLGFVTKSGNIPVGGTLLFTYAIGMGVLFWVLAAFAVSLPKSGRWMEWVKSVGGIGLLAAALYFLRPVSSELRGLASASMWFLIGAAALVALGLALGAVHLSFHDRGVVRARKAFAVALTVVGVSGVINWLVTPNRHLPWIHRDTAAVAKLVETEQLAPAPAHPDGKPWLHPAEAAAFAKAQKEGKGVMIDFSATWCAPCQELELTFADGDVYDALTDHFVHLKLDVSEGTDEDLDLQDRYHAKNLPSVVFLGAGGAEVGRVTRYMDAGEMLGDVVKPAVARLQGDASSNPCVATK
jgi:thiol:disulfide interchange protein DsbD